MRTTLILAVLFLAGFFVWRSFAIDAEPAAPTSLTQDDAAQSSAIARPDAASGTVASVEPQPEAAATAQSAERTAVTTGDDAGALAVVTGRLVDKDFAPRAGVAVSWRSWKVSGDLAFVGDFPVGGDASKAEGPTRTGPDGRFRFSVARGRAGEIEVDVAQLVLEQGKQRFTTKNGDHDFGDVRALVPSRIAGIVVDENGKPVEGVRVGVDSSGFGLGLQSETKTDAAGAFLIGGLHAGGWKLRTLSPSYLPATLDVALADEEQKRDVVLSLARGNAIAGQVVDDRGVGVAGAKVGCMRSEKLAGLAIQRFSDEEAATTDERGFFTIAGIEGELATVRATHKGHQGASLESVRVGSGNVVLRMERLAQISGTLRDSSGKPIAKSRVTARRAPQSNVRQAPIEDEGDVSQGIALAHVADVAEFDGGEDMPFGIDAEYDSKPRAGLAITDENGAFVIEGVRPGVVVVRANGAHRPVERAGLQVTPAQQLDNLALIADIGSTALVRVVDEKGQPVRDAKVVLEAPRAVQQGGNGMSISRAVRIGGGDGDGNVVSFGEAVKTLGRGVTNEEGIARIAGLSAGAAVARCTHAQFAPALAVSVSLPAQGEAKADLVLRTPGVARLLVTDASGMPIAADYIVRGPIGSKDPVEPVDGRTSADGTARVEPLAKGRYTATLRTAQKSTRVGGMAIMMSAGGQRSLPQTRIEFEVQGGDEVDVALRMPTLATVRGNVTGTKGAAADVEVELESLERAAPQMGIAQGGMDLGEVDIPGLGQQSSTTDSNGSYGIDGVVPGRYSLSWGLPGQAVKDRMEITVADGQTDVVQDLRLRYGSLRVVVVGDGEPVEGAEIELLAMGANDAAPKPRSRMVMVSMTIGDDGGGSSSSSLTMGAQSVRTDVDGEATVENVPPGRYIVRITHSRFAKRELPAQDVIENAQTDCGRVQLDAAGQIRGRVLTADGKPAKMTLVQCRKAGDTSGDAERKPSMNGTFRITGLAAGRYELTAQGMTEGVSGVPVVVEVEAGKTKGDVELRLPQR